MKSISSLEGGHTESGNCWVPSYDCPNCGENLCDVCHRHSQPRGECSICPPCESCERAIQSLTERLPQKKRDRTCLSCHGSGSIKEYVGADNWRWIMCRKCSGQGKWGIGR